METSLNFFSVFIITLQCSVVCSFHSSTIDLFIEYFEYIRYWMHLRKLPI